VEILQLRNGLTIGVSTLYGKTRIDFGYGFPYDMNAYIDLLPTELVSFSQMITEEISNLMKQGKLKVTE
jgi:hypothetical protein